MGRFFRATHKENGSVIEFNLGDLVFSSGPITTSDCNERYYQINIRDQILERGRDLSNIHRTCYIFFSLGDYKLEYQHKGEWFDY